MPSSAPSPPSASAPATTATRRLLLAACFALILGSCEETPVDVSEFSDDCTCACFDSQREAQAYYEQRGRPGRLDTDSDGVACEHLR